MDQGNCKNMVSNLPLLFTGGYPTSLEKITEVQLEKFIPFMVQCSLGFIQIATSDEYSEPEWWPGDLDFTIPFRRPATFIGNWLEKMRELVVICYSFHKCVFLLRFCTDLATYEPATLRFINNYNSTTSLYERRTNKLLVTFRNENMLYDQPQQTSNRKCLLPKSSSTQQLDTQQEQMVEPAFFDIYLCDDCDAELYSYDAFLVRFYNV
uniref:DNA-binding protein P3A2 n=1 Tax=Culex pipiens TaxID=7175 RepID=A0A8D8ESS1_CULPI